MPKKLSNNGLYEYSRMILPEPREAYRKDGEFYYIKSHKVKENVMTFVRYLKEFKCVKKVFVIGSQLVKEEPKRDIDVCILSDDFDYVIHNLEWTQKKVDINPNIHIVTISDTEYDREYYEKHLEKRAVVYERT